MIQQSQILTNLLLRIFRVRVSDGMRGALRLSVWTRNRYEHACRQCFTCCYLEEESTQEL